MSDQTLFSAQTVASFVPALASIKRGRIMNDSNKVGSQSGAAVTFSMLVADSTKTLEEEEEMKSKK